MDRYVSAQTACSRAFTRDFQYQSKLCSLVSNLGIGICKHFAKVRAFPKWDKTALRMWTVEEYLQLHENLQKLFDFDATKLTTTKTDPMSSLYSSSLGV